MYLIDSLSCQGPKTPSPGRVYKGTPPTGKAQRKKHFKDTHVHTHTPAGAHIDMFTVSVSSCHPRSLSLTSLKYSWCFTASGHRTPATFLAINAQHLEMIL